MDRAGFEQEQLAWQTLLNSLSGAEIENVISLTTLAGQVYPVPRWRILQHLILHGMQHHTELAQLLTAKGQSFGDIDFIFFWEACLIKKRPHLTLRAGFRWPL